MSVACPSCKQKIVIKAPKPGRFKIKCAKCSHAFVLTVADDLTMKAAALATRPVATPDASSTAKKPAVTGKQPSSATAPPRKQPTPNDPNLTVAPPEKPAKPRPPAGTPKPSATAVDDDDAVAARALLGDDYEEPAPAGAVSDPSDFDMTAASGDEAAQRESSSHDAEGTVVHEEKEESPRPPRLQKSAARKTAPPPDPEATGDFADRTTADEPVRPRPTTRPKRDAAPDTTATLDEPPDDPAEPDDPDVTAAHDDDDRSARPRRAAVDDTAAVEAEDAGTTRAGPKPKSEEPTEEQDPDMPAVLGNYDIVKRLGKGGMGAVYLARQRSLDRAVAIKVINSKWANDSRFLVRFTREAYAAAQLVHHNVVQVYDIGEDAGINWFSMEYVEGTSLGGLLIKKGRLEPKTAVGYILQAARGLQFAHERGMVHRDIKPDNLMLNKHGVVKVADLGLVRTPGAVDEPPDPQQEEQPRKKPPKGTVVGTLSSLAGVTLANQTMGTPSYMAPEQARDATQVDERADIYSLGCTLYVLVTGKPVFRGKTPQEVMQRHQSEALTPPEIHVKTLPKPLSAIIVKMLEKDPAQRQQTTAELVESLEGFLGVGEGTTTAFTDENTETLEKGVKAFVEAPAAKRRPLILAASMATAVLAVLGSLVMGQWFAATCFLGLAILTPLVCFTVNGFYGQSYLFRKAREYLLGNRWFDWLKVFFASILFLAILYFIGALLALVVVCVAAVGLAFAMYFLLDRPVARQRQGALADVEKMLKGVRLRGVSEAAIQEYVCRFAGEHWEEAFEEMFGYDAKLAARAQWGAGPKGPRPKFAAWRDPLVRWVEERQRARKEARERKHLQAVEQKNLVADGMKPAEARRQAEAVAEAMVEMAAEMKQEAKEDPFATRAPENVGVTESPRHRRMDLRQLCEVADKPPVARRKMRALAGYFGVFVGGGVRLPLGAALLCIGIGYLHEAKVTDKLKDNPLDIGTWQEAWTTANATQITIPYVPDLALSCLAIVVAGFLLLLTTFQRIRWLALLHYVCVGVILFGAYFGMPEVGPLNPALLSLAAGSAGSVLLIVFAWMRPRPG